MHALVPLFALACASLPAQHRGLAGHAGQGTGAQARPLPTLSQLSADLRALHRGVTADRKLDRFEALLQITPRGKDKDRVTIMLDVRFLLGRKPLIRYRTKDGGRLIERGQDAHGPWARVGDEVADLRARSYRQDLRQLRREMRLARLLLRFLDPAAVLKSLGGKPTIARETLVISRRLPSIPCYTVAGRLESFPFYEARANTHAAWVKIWIEVKTKRLTAIHAYPLDETGRRLRTGEFVLLAEPKMHDGVLLPTRLLVDQITIRGRKPLVGLELSTFTLFGTLGERDFDRTVAWK